MTIQLKKLLLVSITLLLGAMSVGVRAQTSYYDFSYSSSSNGLPQVIVDGNLELFNGVVIALGWHGGVVIDGSNGPAGAVTSILAPGYDFGGGVTNDNIWTPDSNGIGFAIGANAYRFYLNSGGTYTLSGYPDGDNTGFFNTGNETSRDIGGPGSYGGSAPEMNASFIPQVGLLLGCLFFLLGRKKEFNVGINYA